MIKTQIFVTWWNRLHGIANLLYLSWTVAHQRFSSHKAQTSLLLDFAARLFLDTAYWYYDMIVFMIDIWFFGIESASSCHFVSMSIGLFGLGVLMLSTGAGQPRCEDSKSSCGGIDLNFDKTARVDDEKGAFI